MKHLLKLQYALVLLAVLMLPCLRMSAQSAVSQVSGVVKDGTGALISDAEVEMKSADTNIIHTVHTDERGAYTIPSLPIGPYVLQVKKQGFSTYVQTGIT